MHHHSTHNGTASFVPMHHPLAHRPAVASYPLAHRPVASYPFGPFAPMEVASYYPPANSFPPLANSFPACPPSTREVMTNGANGAPVVANGTNGTPLTPPVAAAAAVDSAASSAGSTPTSPTSSIQVATCKIETKASRLAAKSCRVSGVARCSMVQCKTCGGSQGDDAVVHRHRS